MRLTSQPDQCYHSATIYLLPRYPVPVLHFLYNLMCYGAVLSFHAAIGNLAVALTLAAIELGIRKPDAIMAAYSPFMVELCISPSRLLSVFDPLLPQGILLACLDAYAGSPR